ncbi:MAG: phosphoglycerate mutase [Xanthomonadaceae bacterium]|nr:phosphoglycerate mutase [Xanthomonadaceae bacterium]MDE1885771.1 phosphoglycerate mutase [Xanthomonadaceae bacterium]MDE1960939.1 phosphoglycerate mutase [Xanthomonadaceae bacterium]MDE2084639.1 phosphoglycerate mutase [Xanthomonadaceae bacterium]
MPALTLLLPEFKRVEHAPPFSLWLARGDRLADAKPGRDVVLRECFEFTGTALPVAALTRSLDAGDATGATWVRADPAYARADAVTARLMACGDLGLTHKESDELARALRPLFGDAGFPLEASRPDRWYLRCPNDTRLPAFADTQNVLGDDLMRHLPRGDNERQWRSLFNEAQVILHNHAVNARRIERGQVPVNSLWFWGAGKLPDWVRTPFSHIASGDPAVVALAKRAGIPVAAALTTLSREDAGANILIDAEAVPEIDARRFARIDLLFASGERFRYQHSHRWRIWRRVRR